jgi:transglutaminase-like putative cysteine protease
MCSRQSVLVVLVALAGLAVGGRSVAAEGVLPAWIAKHYSVDVIVNPDGTSSTTQHAEYQANNDGGARRISELTLDYWEGLQDLEIVEALTRKADGRELLVDPASIFVRTPAGTASAPMYSGAREKAIVFPDVAAGDTVVYTARLHDNFTWPNNSFTIARTIPRTIYVEDWRETVLLPKSMQGMADHHDLTYAREEREDGVLHSWTYRQTAPLTEDRRQVSGYDKGPRLFLSTFRDVAELAEAYSHFIDGKADVTRRIAALAEQLTQDVSDRREQARVIYDWVTTHIRYVSIHLGRGGLEPHEADLVLANGYGDCKDHSVLLKALLAAKDIASEIVLINADDGYSLPAVPTLLPLDHMITYVPEFDLYVDSTSEVSPFGVLPFTEYDKPVIHVGSAGPALRRIPPLLASMNEATVVTSEELLPDGRIIGTTSMTASGPLGRSLRLAAASAEAAGPAMATRQLRSLNEPGTGEFSFAPPRRELMPSYTVESKFTLDAELSHLAGTAFAPRIGLTMLVRPGQFLLGPSEADPIEPAPCYAGHQSEEIRLTLPEGYEIDHLPRATRIEGTGFGYHEHWEQAERTVTVYREFTARFVTNLCSWPFRQTLAKSLSTIEDSYRNAIRLRRTS